MAYPMMKVQAIKDRVTIPMYFENIIVPQMKDYYSDYEVNFDYRPVVKCPLHTEDTPSFRFYEDTQSFYCFGCSSGGDIITLHRKYIESTTNNKPTFEESVQFLYGYFIEGREEVQLPNKTVPRRTTKQVNETKSTPIELFQYQRYIKMIEDSLIDMEETKEKYKLYNEIDEICLLVDNNKINATEAIKYLKEKEIGY